MSEILESRKHYPVLKHPGLARLFLCRNPVQVMLLNSLPMLIGLGLLAWQFESQRNLATKAGIFAAGVFYWTFVEYAIHRWLYHVKLPWRLERFVGAFHAHHHAHIGDLTVLNAGPALAIPFTVVVLAPVLGLSLGDLELTAWIGLGMISSYSVYEWVHYGIHYQKHDHGYMAFIQRYHLHHHLRGPRANFGNTSSLWDRLLGTYDKGYQQLEIGARDERLMVRGQRRRDASREHQHG